MLDDADLARRPATTAFSVSTHAGQGCAITTRLLVPRERYEEAVDGAASTMASLGAKRSGGPRHDLRAGHLAGQRDRC